MLRRDVLEVISPNNTVQANFKGSAEAFAIHKSLINV